MLQFFLLEEILKKLKQRKLTLFGMITDKDQEKLERTGNEL